MHLENHYSEGTIFWVIYISFFSAVVTSADKNLPLGNVFALAVSHRFHAVHLDQ